ncbi:efflux RND transporter periplasmic adaptor subunit [uncultured Chitinophaga sp.]|uniref:efflux RND transporter periplasmic adaptor subunit n=1 Tax=uncultured Chitinophaga sp. TaxID=339340 RepID=UPI0025FF760A|nr:efflux RND transporter periplasmic adaptor subunit [uncultured Chitinophaga sp.]
MRKALSNMIFAVALMGCAGKSTEQQEAAHEAEKKQQNLAVITDVQRKTIGLQSALPQQRAISHLLKVNGVLDVPPQNLVSISAPMGGFLRRTELLEGMKVRKGELLAVLENPDYVQLQQDYLENASQLDYLQTEYDRQQKLAEQEVNAAKVLQQAKAQYLGARARTEGLEKKLAMIGITPAAIRTKGITSTINIYSPIAGYVSEINVNVGKYVTPTDMLFKIVDAEHLHAELTVFEKDVHSLKLGQTVRVQLANEQKERTAKVYLIGKIIDKERTVRVHCHLDQEDEQLLPGMFIKAFVEISPADQWTLPEKAVVSMEGKNYVFVQRGAEKDRFTYELLPVTLLARTDGWAGIELPEGINPEKDSIVTEGAFELLSVVTAGEGGEDH